MRRWRESERGSTARMRRWRESERGSPSDRAESRRTKAELFGRASGHRCPRGSGWGGHGDGVCRSKAPSGTGILGRIGCTTHLPHRRAHGSARQSGTTGALAPRDPSSSRRPDERARSSGEVVSHRARDTGSHQVGARSMRRLTGCGRARRCRRIGSGVQKGENGAGCWGGGQ